MKKIFFLFGFALFSSAAMAQSPATLRGIDWTLSGTKNTNVLRSENGKYMLVFQQDGNLVLYKNGNNPIWATMTNERPSKKLSWQRDGNFVIYDVNNNPIWATNSHNKDAGYITLQNDGNLVIYTYNNQPVWASNTGGL